MYIFNKYVMKKESFPELLRIIDLLLSDLKSPFKNTAQELHDIQYKKISHSLNSVKRAPNIINIVREYLFNRNAAPNIEVLNTIIEKLIEFGKIAFAYILHRIACKHGLGNNIWFSVNFRQQQWKDFRFDIKLATIDSELSKLFGKIIRRFNKEAIADILYSVYLQNLIYKIAHPENGDNKKGQKIDNKDDILIRIVSDKKFFFLENNNLILWKDGKEGFSSLNSASCAGKTEVVELLLKKAATLFAKNKKAFNDFINQKNKHGFTAINNAAFKKRKKVAILLFKKGADPDIQTTHGLSARKSARRNGYGWGFLFNSSNIREIYSDVNSKPRFFNRLQKRSDNGNGSKYFKYSWN